MDFENYQVKDFITDRSFINYFLKSNEQDQRFWKQWLSEHPEKATLVQEAETYLTEIYPTLAEEEYAREYQRFRHTINRTQVEKPAKTNVVKLFLAQLVKHRIAASIIALLGLTAFWLLSQQYIRHQQTAEANQPVEWIEKFAPKGQKSTITLTDGSKIKLNSGSKIRFPKVFAKDIRKVYLEGEAFFDVEQDSTRPFIVHANNVSTKVLGTSFNIRSSSFHNNVEVALVSGHVEVMDLQTDQKLRLIPNELAEVNRSTLQLKKRTFETEQLLGWKEGILQFREATFLEVVETLKNWYNVEIQYTQVPKTKALTAEFDNQSLDTVLQGLSFLMKFSYEIQGSKVIIH
ncbi:FecR domain-containing protein [Rapidithrix thailandica]|uniref:FecR domain-containing protein n=1 Tax=Rapidithrix thailandica TaxID=413964 RepID=A0AAW9S7T2_9BACT